MTVVIPAWNLDRTLREAVRSVRSQDVPSEILVVDNVSERPLPAFPGVRRKRTASRVTIGEARNVGLREVRTKYVLFMDGDDVLLPGTLRRLQKALDKDPELVAVSSWMINWDPKSGRRRRSRWPYGYALRLQRHRRAFAVWNSVRNLFPLAGCALIRTEAARTAGGFPPLNYAEDWCFHATLPFQGKVAITRQAGKLYRIDPEHASLLDESTGSVRIRLRASRELRCRLRAVFGKGSWPGILSYFLAAPHLAFAVRDSLRGKRRA